MSYEEVLSKAKSWSQNTYFSEEDRQELVELIEKGEEKEVFDRFYKDLSFGTGGLRSIVGFGSNRMNIYNVRKAAWALGKTVKKHFGENGKAAISHDSRLTSQEFAKAAAEVLAGMGLEVYLVNRPTPTPVLSYAVRYFKCQCGIMLTASHNPKDYNGFKAYWSDGCQVTPPIDHEIIESFNSLKSWNEIPRFSESSSGRILNFGDEIYDSYYSKLEAECLNPSLVKENGKDISVVYTPLHGTGGEFCNEIASRLGFTNFNILQAQAKPDGNFPTAEYPNPEDPKSLALAVDEMLRTNADIVLGSDPDTDRMGVVYNNEGVPYYLNGNEIANLMLFYKLSVLKEQGKLSRDALVLKTIVTSSLQDEICKGFGVQIEDTLTGFKWMGDLLTKKEEKGENFQFVFASEESFGSMTHGNVRDKDGVSSVALFSELTLFYKKQSKSLLDVLGEIYQRFGFHCESLLSLSYYGSEGESKIKKIMNHLREVSIDFFPEQEVSERDDYKKLQKEIFSKGKEKLNFPVASNVIGFTFKNGNKLFARPSGTEPKIKFYSLFKGKNTDESSVKDLKGKISRTEEFLKDFCDKI